MNDPTAQATVVAPDNDGVTTTTSDAACASAQDESNSATPTTDSVDTPRCDRVAARTDEDGHSTQGTSCKRVITQSQHEDSNAKPAPATPATLIDLTADNSQPSQGNQDLHSKRRQRRSPRLRDEERMAAIQAFRYQRHSLRVSASEVAALTGFHPYRRLPATMLDHVYQGRTGDMLRAHDAKLLMIDLVSKEEALLQVAEKAGKAVKKSIQAALAVEKGKRKVSSSDAVQKMKAKIMEEAKRTKVLNKREIRQLQEGTREAINTGFGNCWEDKALDEYEKMCGEQVEERNAELRTWPFRVQNANDGKTDGDGEGEAQLQKTAVPICPAGMEESHSKPVDVGEDQACHEPTDSTEEDRHTLSHQLPKPDQQAADTAKQVKDEPRATPTVSSAETSSGSQSNTNASTELPYFSIRGAVDGVRGELQPNLMVIERKEGRGEALSMDTGVDTGGGSGMVTKVNGDSFDDDNDDDESWVFKRVVVECKHRVERIRPQPPLYEQIQTTIYCLMYDADDADIIQVLRKRKKRRKRIQRGTAAPATAPTAGGGIVTGDGASSETTNGGNDPSKDTASTKAADKARSVGSDAHEKKEHCGKQHQLSEGTSREPCLSGSNDEEAKTSDACGQATKAHAEEQEDDMMSSNAATETLDTQASRSGENSSKAEQSGTKAEGLSTKRREDGTKAVVDGSTNNNSHVEKNPDKGKDAANDSDDDDDNDDASIEIAVSRMNLDDRVTQHRSNWNATVLPRLRDWVDAVYSIRQDDSKRYQLLRCMAEPTDLVSAWNVVFQECPWLRHCDTCYNRDAKAAREMEMDD